MKKNRKILFISIFICAGGLIYILQAQKPKVSKKSPYSKKPTAKIHKQKKSFLHQTKHSGHNHHGKENDTINKHKDHSDKTLTNSLNKKYKKQIKHYKNRYLKFLSPTIKKEVSVKKELTTKLILLVRTINKNSLAQSFEAIVDKKSGKLIVNQGFTINENAKLPRFTPSGEKVNP